MLSNINHYTTKLSQRSGVILSVQICSPLHGYTTFTNSIHSYLCNTPPDVSWAATRGSDNPKVGSSPPVTPHKQNIQIVQ